MSRLEEWSIDSELKHKGHEVPTEEEVLEAVSWHGYLDWSRDLAYLNVTIRLLAERVIFVDVESLRSGSLSRSPSQRSKSVSKRSKSVVASVRRSLTKRPFAVPSKEQALRDAQDDAAVVAAVAAAPARPPASTRTILGLSARTSTVVSTLRMTSPDMLFRSSTKALIAQQKTYFKRDPVLRKPPKWSEQPRGGYEYHIFVSKHNDYANALCDEVQAAQRITLKVTNDVSQVAKCERMLVYLTSTTWTRGVQSDNFAHDVRKAMENGVHLLLAHEVPGSEQDDVIKALGSEPVSGKVRTRPRNAATFDSFEEYHRSNERQRELHKKGMYKNVAVPLKGEQWRHVSMCLLAAVLRHGLRERSLFHTFTKEWIDSISPSGHATDSRRNSGEEDNGTGRRRRPWHRARLPSPEWRTTGKANLYSCEASVLEAFGVRLDGHYQYTQKPVEQRDPERRFSLLDMQSMAALTTKAVRGATNHIPILRRGSAPPQLHVTVEDSELELDRRSARPSAGCANAADKV